jgi:branched-chain amino acid transport system substrate-binding protein
MLKRLPALLAAILVTTLSSIAGAADPVKIGLVTTLSGPGGYTGSDVRDGFQLAVAQEGGKLGGVPVSVMVEDDGLKPEQGRAIADRFLQQDHAKIVTGIVFSNVMAVVAPDVLSAGSIYVSPNAGPSTFAGENCNKDLFVASFQNDAANIPVGVYAEKRGYKNIAVVTPDYIAGRDMVTGFKLGYHGQTQEIYTRLGQTDFSAEIARIRDAKPDALFYFLPGGDGITFLKQEAQSGLKIPIMVTDFSLDQTILGAVGDAALGAAIIGHYNTDFPNAANKAFVSAFQAKYGRLPTFYAAQGYDTAHLIGTALKAAGGDDTKIDVMRATLKKAAISSVRGDFKFGPNQYPIQDYYSMSVERGADGKLAIVTKGQVVKAFGDPFSSKCKL